MGRSPRDRRRDGAGSQSPAPVATRGDPSRSGRAAVREHGAHVAAHAREAGPLEWRIAEPALEAHWLDLAQQIELWRGDVWSYAELGVWCGAREFDVPGAHVLAHVAPEQPLPHEQALGVAEFSAMLDCEVRNAAPGVED